MGEESLVFPPLRRMPLENSGGGQESLHNYNEPSDSHALSQVDRWLRSFSPPGSARTWNSWPPTTPSLGSDAALRRCSGSTRARRLSRSLSPSTSAAGRSIIGWSGSTTATNMTSSSDWPTLLARADRVPETVVSTLGSPRSSIPTHVPSVTTRRSGPHLC